jgi:phage-related protein
MPAQTFTPVVNPTPPISAKITPRVLRAQFGDGYSQRAGDGLNTKKRTYELSWETLILSEVDAIIGFFEGLEDGEAFLWTPNDGSAQGLFVVSDWSRTRLTAAEYSCTATFTEEFDLVA